QETAMILARTAAGLRSDHGETLETLYTLQSQRYDWEGARVTLGAQRLEARMRELERSKEEFATLVATVDQAADRDVDHLIGMYERMKPKQAGPLFDTMDPAFAAGFLARMKTESASAIMANMQPDRAHAATLYLAGRNVRREPTVGGGGIAAPTRTPRAPRLPSSVAGGQ
ncbi:MAG: hypothetical protein AAGM38_13845, partial [Pseudomonadota bacterium]